MIFFTLFYEFFKIGLFAVGGGMATIPFLIDLAERYPWFTVAELANMIAISESTPGPIGINMATYTGFQTSGLLGSLIATIGLVTPSVIIIVIIAKFMSAFSDNRYVRAAFYGIRPMIAALIGYAVWQIVVITYVDTSKAVFALNFPAILISLIIFICLQIKHLKKIHPIVWIAIGALLGIIFKL